MIAWLSSLLRLIGMGPAEIKPKKAASKKSPAKTAPRQAPPKSKTARTRTAARPAAATPVAEREPESFPKPVGGVGNLDAAEIRPAAPRPSNPANELTERIERRIQKGRFELPQLPSTSMSLMEMTSNPSVDFKELATVIECDPTLSSEVLRVANSVVCGARVPTTSLQDAIARQGIQSLRSVILSLSMRGAILRANNIKAYAEETWRQAYSMATICRAVARFVDMDPEQAYLLGLLHDIGKVSLIHMVWKESKKDDNVSPAMMGNLYRRFHEDLGRRVAEEWKLSEEITAVAGCHHDFRRNADYPRSAALVSLVHKMDLYLSMGYEGDFLSLIESDEVQVLLASDFGKARTMLYAGQTAFQETHERQLAAA